MFFVCDVECVDGAVEYIEMNRNYIVYNTDTGVCRQLSGAAVWNHLNEDRLRGMQRFGNVDYSSPTPCFVNNTLMMRQSGTTGYTAQAKQNGIRIEFNFTTGVVSCTVPLQLNFDILRDMGGRIEGLLFGNRLLRMSCKINRSAGYTGVGGHPPYDVYVGNDAIKAHISENTELYSLVLYEINPEQLRMGLIVGMMKLTGIDNYGNRTTVGKTFTFELNFNQGIVLIDRIPIQLY